MLMPQIGFPGVFELKNCTINQSSKYTEYKWDTITFGPMIEDLPPFQTLVGLFKNYTALEDFSGSVYVPSIYTNQELRIDNFLNSSKIGSIIKNPYGEIIQKDGILTMLFINGRLHLFIGQILLTLCTIFFLI